MKRIDLENVMLSPKTAGTWEYLCQITIVDLKNKGIRFRPEEIGEEYAELDEETNVLTIKCEIGDFVMSLDVPPSNWCWNN
jgi:hypothetical protein